MESIGLISLGVTTVNSKKLKKLIKKSQEFDLDFVTNIENIGNPDIEDFFYSDRIIERTTRPHRNGFNFYCIITSVPIEGNYFTRSFGGNIILVTFHDTDDLLISSKRTPEEYVGLAIIQEILSFEFQRVTQRPSSDLFHLDPRGCIFDFAKYKPQKLFKLRKSHVCNTCLGTLTGANINMRFLHGSNKIIHYIIKPKLFKSVILCIIQPVLSFFYGGIVLATVINFFSALMFTDKISQGQYNLFFIIASLVVLVPV